MPIFMPVVVYSTVDAYPHSLLSLPISIVDPRSHSWDTQENGTGNGAMFYIWSLHFGNGTINHNCARESCTLTYFNISPHFLLMPFTLNALSYLLLYIASYEFVCAQSPHSMKGLLIGTFFAIKGIFQLFGVVLYSVIGAECNVKFGLPVSTFIYYFINIVIALIGLIAFVLVVRKYQYRQRDEPDNIYRYAEEYYANAQDETSYGYDNDDDNLKGALKRKSNCPPTFLNS